MNRNNSASSDPIDEADNAGFAASEKNQNDPPQAAISDPAALATAANSHRRTRGPSRERKRSHTGKRIEFRAFPEEVEALKKRAAETSMTVSEFCRRAASGKRITSRYDYDVIHRLAALHGDQARLGNLFKASLNEDHQAYSQNGKAVIRTLLMNLERNQDHISRILREIGESDDTSGSFHA
jgi:hypothetical protein